MAELTVQASAVTGLETVFVAADVAGDMFLNDGSVVFIVKNSGGVDRTVTVDSVAACNFGFDHDAVVVVTAAEERIIGPFSTARFNDGASKVQVTYSLNTGLTVAAVDVSG